MSICWKIIESFSGSIAGASGRDQRTLVRNVSGALPVKEALKLLFDYSLYLRVA